MATQYVIYDNGTPAVQEYDDGMDAPVPIAGRVVTEAEYLQAYNALQDQINARRSARAEAQQAAAQSAYNALIAAGASPEGASFVTHYTPSTGGGA
ncbi:hypothetical protein [Streptomyces sp. NPDC001076]